MSDIVVVKVPEIEEFQDKNSNATKIPKRDWTEYEEDFLESNYGKIKTHDIAKELGRSYNSVNKHASAMGLRITPTA